MSSIKNFKLAVFWFAQLLDGPYSIYTAIWHCDISRTISWAASQSCKSLSIRSSSGCWTNEQYSGTYISERCRQFKSVFAAGTWATCKFDATPTWPFSKCAVIHSCAEGMFKWQLLCDTPWQDLVHLHVPFLREQFEHLYRCLSKLQIAFKAHSTTSLGSYSHATLVS